MYNYTVIRAIGLQLHIATTYNYNSLYNKDREYTLTNTTTQAYTKTKINIKINLSDLLSWLPVKQLSRGLLLFFVFITS